MGFNGSSSIEAISVLGIGKLGAVVAGCLASRGFPVIGVDVNRHSVDSCNRGVPPIQEPGIEDLYRSCQGLLTATTDTRLRRRKVGGHAYLRSYTERCRRWLLPPLRPRSV